MLQDVEMRLNGADLRLVVKMVEVDDQESLTVQLVLLSGN